MSNCLADISAISVDQNAQRGRNIISPPEPREITDLSYNPGGALLMRRVLFRWRANDHQSYREQMVALAPLGAAGKPSTTPHQVVRR